MKKKIWRSLICAAMCLVMAVTMLPAAVRADITLAQDSDGYYLIGNEADLFAFAELVNGGEYGANGKLTADITMTGEAKPWIPIAKSASSKESYTGTFDGQGHTISNLYFKDTTLYNVGLFGCVDDGTIRNVIVADSYIAGGAFGGAIAGRFFGESRIEGCGNLNTTVECNCAGGIVGGTNCPIIACWNTGKISAKHWAGGICGDLSGSVKGCWNTGEITGNWAGGIIGGVQSSQTVVYCYNEGMVVGNNGDVEGTIVGHANSAQTHPKMENCYYLRVSGSAIWAYGEESDWVFTNVDRVKNTMLPTGEGAWFLNQGLAGTGYQYYQNLDSGSPDAYPVLSSSHGKVYRGYKACSDTLAYSNSPLAEKLYHAGIGYSTEGATVKEVCANACNLTTGLGSITLTVKDAYYTGSAHGATVTGKLLNGATCKVTYDDAEKVPDQVGSHTAKLTVYEGSAEKASVTADYKISYLPAPALSWFTVAGHSNFADGVYWFQDAFAKVTPPEGYTIANVLGGTYGLSIDFQAEDTKTVYLKRTSDGALTDAIDLSGILKFDTTAPTAKITLSSGDLWSALQNTASFDRFFKETKTVAISAEDQGSGVKSVQFYAADGDLIDDDTLDNSSAIAKLEAAIGDDWDDYGGEMTLALKDKNIIYAKITDIAGNVSYISSDGIVIYSDAALQEDTFTITYGKAGDIVIPVTFNGNTVKEIREETWGHLTPDTHYSVDADKITLKADFLNSLNAADYCFAIDWNPLGEAYAEAEGNEAPRQLKVMLTVKLRQVEVPAADERSFVYNGAEQVYEIADSQEYTVTGNKQTAAGTYTVTVALKDRNNTVWTDGTTEDKTYPFCIEKATFDMSGVKWNYTEPFCYDAMTHTVELTGLPGGVSASYTGNTATVTGDYLAEATLSYDADNYNPITVPVLYWSIGNDWTPAEYTLSGEGWQNRDFVITPTEGYQISLTNTAEGVWMDNLTFTEETENGSVTFYLKNEKGHISLEKTETYKLDKTDPTGGIAVDERSWNGFFGSVFDFFSGKDMIVTITAEDALSGVEKMEYFESAEALDLAGVQAVTDWTEGDTVYVTKEDAKQFIYYARITDKAGNITYLASNGTEFDTTAPEIVCVDSEVYYVTTKVTITDKNLATVDLGQGPIAITGDAVTWLLPGNKDAEHTVTATDKAGNVTTRIFKTAAIESLDQPIEDLSQENVKFTDQHKLDQLREVIAGIDQTNANAEEKATLKALENQVQALQDRLDDLNETFHSETISNGLEIHKGNVTAQDKETLEDAIAGIEKLQEDFAGNLDEESQMVMDMVVKQMRNALKAIENAEKVQKVIHKLPKTAEPDDEKAIQAVKEAKAAYDALTDTEKAMVDTKALEKLMDALSMYAITKGDKGVWTGEGTLSFTANGAFGKFEGITVDGKEVDSRHYEAKSGSTVITLKESYLKKLKDGKHTFAVLYADGEAEGSFTVQTRATPGTGDIVLPVLIGVAALALVGIIVLLIIKSKQKNK